MVTDGLARVALVIRVPEGCALIAPPDGSSSCFWTRKLWSAFKPTAPKHWAAVLQGNLSEVSSHLWHHQALFLQLDDGQDSQHLCVQFSELLDPSDFGTQVVRDVDLDDEFGREGMKISFKLMDLEASDLDLSVPKDGFLLTLALQGANDGEDLRLRFDSVETSMRRSDVVRYQFPLVDSWEDLREALAELQVYLQIEDEAQSEIPMDLSDLIAIVDRSEGGEVQSAVHAGQASFLATIGRENATQAKEVPDLDLWERGARLLAVGPRQWRLSIEIQSLRLTERGANVFVSYSYPMLKQPRPFRTTPPNLVRKKASVAMPHSFAAYSFTASFEDLQSGLEEPLYLEVWHRDLYRKDSVVGVVEADLSKVSSQPLQRSSIQMPSVESYRSLEQVCPIISEDESQVGALRLVVFLEDLGLVPCSKVEVQRPVEKYPVSKVPSGAAASVKAAQAASMEGQVPSGAPAMKGAYELEMWRQAEEEKFRVYLLEQEQDLQERLEDEYRQKEELRASDFEKRKAKLQDLEITVRRKLQELQEREMQVVAEEAKVATLKEETTRRMGMAVSQHEDATKRETTEAEHRLELSRQRSHFLEEQCQSLEAKLEGQMVKLSALQQKHLERRKPEVHQAPEEPDLSEELHGLRMQLREQQLRNEAIATSRDHFKRKVEELCSRLMGPEAQLAAVSVVATPQGPDLATALRQVQEDLAKLADSWAETPKRTPSTRVQATPESTQKIAETRAVRPQDPARQEQHLAWLCAQRQELLESGLYGSADPVLQALELKIAQAEAQLRVANLKA